MAAALAIIVAVTRWLDAARTLYTVDSVLFSLGMHRYDLMSLRPHPPGYPVFVALGWTAYHVLGDENRALVFLAAGFSVATAVLLYGFCREFVSIRTSLAVTLLFCFTPAFYFNGVIALSYTAEAAVSLAVAWTAWRYQRRPTRGGAILLATLLGLGIGIRQSLALFLAPLVALVLFAPPWNRALGNRVGWAAGVGLVVVLSWFVPMSLLTGGFARAQRATQLQANTVVFADAVWRRGVAAFVEHTDRLAYYFRFETTLVLPLFLVLVLIGAIVWYLRRADATQIRLPWKGVAFFVAWLVPPLAFYLFVFDGWDRGPIGYVLTLLPGVYIAGAIVVEACLGHILALPRSPRTRIVVACLAVFVLASPLPALASESRSYVRHEVRAHDDWTAQWNKIRLALPPNETAILAWYSWAHVKWYFPDYVAWAYFPIVAQSHGGAATGQVVADSDWVLYFQMHHQEDERPFIDLFLAGPGQPEHPVPGGIKRIVLFDVQLAGEDGAQRRLASDVPVHQVSADGWRVLVVDTDPARPTIESYFRPLNGTQPAGA